MIYVRDEQFYQCKYLLLNIPIEKISTFDDLESIDEATEKLDKSIEEDYTKKIKIPPEVEFWGHCSNLQVWAENNYDTRILHSNLAFPLLKRLTELGDPIAKRVFKEEIVKRFNEGNSNVADYLALEGYLDYLKGMDFWDFPDYKSFLKSNYEFIGELENILGVEMQLTREVDDYMIEAYGEPYMELNFGKIIGIYINNCGLQSLPDSINELKSLKKIILNENKLTELPESIWSLTLLKRLEIIDNQLTSIPRAIKNLKELTWLRLSFNQIESLPEEIGQLEKLKYLDLVKNNLKKLPESIGNLKSLKELNIAGNSLEDLPNSLKKNEKIKIILK